MSDELMVTNSAPMVNVSNQPAPAYYDYNYASTLTLDTPKDKNRFLRARNAAASLAQSFGDGEVMELVDVFQTPGVRRSRDINSPDMPCVNTYLLLSDGRAYMSQSGGIADSIRDLVTCYPNCGRDTDEGFIRVTIQSRQLSSGNTIKAVVPVD